MARNQINMARTIAGTRTSAGDRVLSSSGNAKLFLGGTRGYINIAQGSVTFVPTDSFTVEFFTKYSLSQNNTTYLGSNYGAGSTSSIVISTSTGGLISPFVRDNNGISYNQISSGHNAINDNNWHHVALVIDGSNNSANIFIDGVGRSVKTYTRTGNIVTSINTFVGCRNNRGTADQYFTGLIDEIRISNIVRYTTTFTPPTILSPFVSDVNTILLAHFNEQGTPIDSSSNAKTMAVVGNINNTLGYFIDSSVVRTTA